MTLESTGPSSAVECLHRVKRDLTGRTPPAYEWAETMLDEGLEAL